MSFKHIFFIHISNEIPTFSRSGCVRRCVLVWAQMWVQFLFINPMKYQHFRFWRFLSLTKVSIFPRKYQHFLNFHVKLLQNCFISNVLATVLRYADLMTLFRCVECQAPLFARGAFVTRPMVFQWFWHMGSATCDAVVKNHCFYTGFISKMKSLAYFCLASWVGLKAPFVTLVLRHALKPQRGSKYYGETSLLAL